jgi:hypothetical protein
MAIDDSGHSLDVKILDEELKAPEHRLTVEISRQRRQGLLLVSIDSANQAKRDVLLFTKPKEVVSLFPPAIKEMWDSFLRQFNSLQRDWGIGAVPAFKRAERLYRQGEVLGGFNLATVAYHFGAVPALVLGNVDGIKVALLPDSDEHSSERAKYSDEEHWELLYSLDRYLPLILPAYYEQIGNYLRSIFFAAQDHKAMPFCLRIRQIATTSIRGKLNSIQSPKYRYGKSGKLARHLREKFSAQINEGRAVDAFAHLITNYIYSFYCIHNRISDYHDRLAALPSSRTLFAADSVSFMQECGRNLKNPSDEFQKQLTRDKETRDPWLQTMGEMSAFVAEIIASLGGKAADVPRVFVTYHYKVKDSEHFRKLAQRRVELDGEKSFVELVFGRHVRRDVRWSILARIWLADHHLLFLPSTWARIDSEEKIKSLKTELNWVVIELFYSRLLGREVSITVPSPHSDAAVDRFRNHIRSYTEKKEIPHITHAGWPSFVRRAKEEIADLCYGQRRIPLDLDSLDSSAWETLQKHVFQRAARNLIRVLFNAWCCSFDAERWSVVQALILLKNEDSQEAITVRRLCLFITQKAPSVSAFRWAKLYHKQAELERALRDHLGTTKSFGTLRQFAFLLKGKPFHPIAGTRKGRYIEIEFPIEELYLTMCGRFGVPEDRQEYEEICQFLLSARPQD